MVNNDYTLEEAEQLFATAKIDLVAFGRHFIPNPDVIPRLKGADLEIHYHISHIKHLQPLPGETEPRWLCYYHMKFQMRRN